MEQDIVITKGQAYRFQIVFCVLFFLTVVGVILIRQGTPAAVWYWAVLFLVIAFFQQSWLRKAAVLIVKNWWGLDRASALRLFKLVCAVTVAFCLVIHGFLFANEFFSHDSLTYVTYDTSTVLPVWVATGRMLVPVYELIKGPAAAPWLIGMLFILWMVLANLLLARFLRLKSRIAIVLTCGLLCANHAIILFGATYITWLDNNAFAILAAVAAAYFFCRCVYAAPLGVLCCVISLAIYQAYFTITVALCFFAALQALLAGEKVGSVIRKGLRYIALFCVSFIVYCVVWRSVCSAMSLSMSRVGESILLSSLDSVIGAVKTANLNFFSFLLDTDGMFGGLRVAVNLCLAALFGIYLLGWMLEDGRSVGSRVLLGIMVCLLPTVLNAIYILVPQWTDLWMLTVITREFFYLFVLIILLESDSSKVRVGTRLRVVTAGLICIVIFQNGVFANQAYIKKELEKSATLSVVTRILNRIEMTEGYAPGETQVAFLGELTSNPNLSIIRNGFQTISSAYGLWGSYAPTYNIDQYICSYLGYPLNLYLGPSVGEWEAVQNMPAFPARDAIQFVDGILVVKLS